MGAASCQTSFTGEDISETEIVHVRLGADTVKVLHCNGFEVASPDHIRTLIVLYYTTTAVASPI